MGYQSDYARTVADIYSQLGQGQAQARLQQGSAWANAFGQIGQTVAAIPGQMQAGKDAEAQRVRLDADDKRQARQDEIQEWTFDQARNKAHDQSVLARVASSSMVDGKYDFTKMMELGQQEGVPMESLTEAIGRLRQFQASDVELQTRLTQGKITQMQYEEALLENFSKEAILAGFDPEAMGLIFQTAKDMGMNIDRWKQAWEKDPEALAAEIKKRYGGPPPPTREIQTRNPDGSVKIQIVADTPGQTFTSAAEPIDVGSFQYYVTALYGLRPTPAQIASARRSYEEAGRPPTVATFEWARLPDGQVRYLTPQEIRKQGGAKVEAPRPNTEDEKKTIGFVRQVAQAIAIMDLVEDSLTKDELYQIQSLPQEGVAGWMNRSTTSENAKRYLRAMEQFTEAALRPVSGAAIQPSEYAQYRRTYGKQYGETTQLATDRRNARSLIKSALEQRAGSLFTGDSPAPGAGGGVQEGTEQAIPGIPGGVAKFTNGKWIRVK